MLSILIFDSLKRNFDWLTAETDRLICIICYWRCYFHCYLWLSKIGICLCFSFVVKSNTQRFCERQSCLFVCSTFLSEPLIVKFRTAILMAKIVFSPTYSLFCFICSAVFAHIAWLTDWLTDWLTRCFKYWLSLLATSLTHFVCFYFFSV